MANSTHPAALPQRPTTAAVRRRRQQLRRLALRYLATDYRHSAAAVLALLAHRAQRGGAA